MTKLSYIFQVISAQQLPKPEWEKASSIVDPQVWVEIYGVPIDNMKKKTHHIENNGKCQFFKVKGVSIWKFYFKDFYSVYSIAVHSFPI